MGCSAVTVAAVPIQGLTFWQRCGYEIVVPLKKEGVMEPGLDEPLTAFGGFLLNHMLLFTDTPLVAKILTNDVCSGKKLSQEELLQLHRNPVGTSDADYNINSN